MRDDKSAWSQNLIVVKVLINPQAHSVARSIAKSVLGVFYPELSGGDLDESRAICLKRLNLSLEVESHILLRLEDPEEAKEWNK